MLKYTDITQNTYIKSWKVTEIMAREIWKYDSSYTRNTSRELGTVRGTARRPHFSLDFIPVTVQLRI